MEGKPLLSSDSTILTKKDTVMVLVCIVCFEQHALCQTALLLIYPDDDDDDDNSTRKISCSGTLRQAVYHQKALFTKFYLSQYSRYHVA
jgi:hypothetical protein